MLNIGIGESNVRHLDEIILENETLGRGDPLNTVSEAGCKGRKRRVCMEP